MAFRLIREWAPSWPWFRLGAIASWSGGWPYVQLAFGLVSLEVHLVTYARGWAECDAYVTCPLGRVGLNVEYVPAAVRESWGIGP